MKDSDQLRIKHNDGAASPGLSLSNIAIPDGLYVIPAPPVEAQGQQDEMLVSWISGGLWGALLGLALVLMILFAYN